MSQKLGIAILGSGRIATIHIKDTLNNPNLKLLYIYDIDLKFASRWSDRVPNSTKITDNLDEVLGDPGVIGIIVCSPTDTHKELVLKSLRAGKAVFCEKPVSLKVEDIDECYNEAKKHNLPLLCGFQRRHDPHFRKVRNLLKQGTIGNLRMAKTISRDASLPPIAYLKTSCKVFHDSAVHDIDILRWIAEDDPVEVYVNAQSFDPQVKAIQDWDLIVISLKFRSGVLGLIELSRISNCGYDQRMEVLGDKGSLTAENPLVSTVLQRTPQGILSDPFYDSFLDRYPPAYENELNHFVDVLLGKATPIVTHDDARKASIICSAAQKSAETGQKVVIQY
jgi:myo-inositol 2-dehydrogenase/D-chiro-inositol 1-dehydrogenase